MADTPEPFSPSIFLDLPPTPRADDHVLPFISRVLMEEEEDTNDEAFFYPADHPALLQVQQPFAEILSDATNTAADDVNNGSVEMEDKKATAALPPADDDVDLQQGALVSSLFGGRGGHDDMLTRAFLKGVEEAKKFLPTTTGTNSLLICSETETSGSREHEQVIKKDGNKNRRRTDDSVAAGGGRNTKLMVPVPDEETDGETVDQMILHDFNVCISKLTTLHITTTTTTTGGGEAETTTTPPTMMKKKKKIAANSTAGDDLHTLLIHCAQAVGSNDRLSAAKLLRQIKAQSSPRGDPNQRLAHCFAEGLEARLAGTGTQLYRSLVSKRTSAVEYLKAYHVYLNSCCFKKVSFTFSNRSILKAIDAAAAAAGRKTKMMKLHIVDYGIDYGMQWPNLLRRLSTMEVPVELRITGIDHPQPGFRPSSRLEETGRCARTLGVPFKFRSVAAAKWETVRAGDLGIDSDSDSDELLIVNSLGPFTYLINEGVAVDDVDSPSPRDTVLDNIRSLRPDVFVLCVMNASYSSPFFVTRFREALSYYTALFDMLDATLPRDSEQRLLVERELYGRCALNAVACEGWDRVERPEAYRQWQARNHRTGFRQLPLDPETVEFVRDKVGSLYHKDFVIDTDQQWLLKGWKGRILYAISNWRVADHA
ncbi:hypothetical protein U9M48_000226 [Paspalum notatum var. saurae]|uniref:Uncharacterized protein n=1 Tax=Paspalum notatum var. saurae TaxID=547442 RepID=A0AAQ3PHV2_PASNO